MKLNEISKQTHRRILLIGDSGTGKTTLAATFPKPFFADFDHGLDTLAGKNIDGEAEQYAEDSYRAFEEELAKWRKEPQRGCETFVLDSLTLAAQAALWSITRGQVPEIQDWMRYIKSMKTLLGHLTTLDCHVVVIAHLQVLRDATTGTIERVPLMYGEKLPGQLPIYFNDVWYTLIDTPNEKDASYRVQLKPDRKYAKTKCSLDTNAKHIDNPTFTKIMETQNE